MYLALYLASGNAQCIAAIIITSLPLFSFAAAIFPSFPYVGITLTFIIHATLSLFISSAFVKATQSMLTCPKDTYFSSHTVYQGTSTSWPLGSLINVFQLLM